MDGLTSGTVMSAIPITHPSLAGKVFIVIAIMILIIGLVLPFTLDNVVAIQIGCIILALAAMGIGLSLRVNTGRYVYEVVPETAEDMEYLTNNYKLRHILQGVWIVEDKDE